MSFWNPYRDTPATVEERVTAPKYPTIKISTPDRRLIQIDEGNYRVEIPSEHTDAMGVKSTYWCEMERIATKEDDLFGRPSKVPVEVVLWILNHL